MNDDLLTRKVFATFPISAVYSEWFNLYHRIQSAGFKIHCNTDMKVAWVAFETEAEAVQFKLTYL